MNNSLLLSPLFSLIIIISIIIIIGQSSTTLLAQDISKYTVSQQILSTVGVPSPNDGNTYLFRDQSTSDSTLYQFEQPLKFGKTLIIENIDAPNGAIRVGGLLCPGSTLVVKNVKVHFLHIFLVSPLSNCFQACEFPQANSNSGPHKVPYDVDDEYLINVTIMNNEISRPASENLGAVVRMVFTNSQRCLAGPLNNTRVSLTMVENNLTNDKDIVAAINSENVLFNAGQGSPALSSVPHLMYTFFRNIVIKNNNFTLTSCRLYPGDDQAYARNKFSLNLGTTFYDADIVGRPLVSRLEGHVIIEGNKVLQANCLNDVMKLANGMASFFVGVSDYGANPAHLPLQISIRENSFLESKTLAFVELKIYHGRVGYFHADYSSLGSPIAQTSSEMTYYSNHEDHKKIFPQLVFEGNNCTHGNVPPDNHQGCIWLELGIDEDSYEISNYVREYGEDRAVPSSKIDLEYLELLKYYPEKEVLGSAIIRNNRYFFSTPKRPLDPDNRIWEWTRYMRFNFIRRRAAVNLDFNHNLPRNYFVPPFAPLEGRTPLRHNFSSLVYTFDHFVLEENTFESYGATRCFGVVFESTNFVGTLLIKNNNFISNMWQDGRAWNKFGGALPQDGMHINFDHDFTVHRLIIVDNVFNTSFGGMKELTDASGEGFGINTIKTDRLFGVVQLTIRDNVFWVNTTSMGFRIWFAGIYANYFENIHDFPFVSDPKFFNKTKNEFILLEYQSAPRTWEFRNLFLNATSFVDEKPVGSGMQFIDTYDMSFPGGSIIFDNITVFSDFLDKQGLFNMRRYSVIEADRLVFTNLNFTAKLFGLSSAIRFDGSLALIRKEFLVRNIYYRVSPIFYGRFDTARSGNGRAPDGAILEAVRIMLRWVDVATTLKSNDESISPPLAERYYEIIDGPTADDEQLLVTRDILMKFTVENISARFESGICFRSSALLVSLTGMKTSDSLVSNPITVRNVKMIVGKRDEDRSWRDPSAPFGAYDFIHDLKTLFVVALYTTTSFEAVLDPNDKQYEYRFKRDYRTGQMFTSLPSNVPASIVFADSVGLYDAQAAGSLVTVLNYQDERGLPKDSFSPLPPSVNPPNITLRRVRAETYDLLTNQPNLVDHAIVAKEASGLAFYMGVALNTLIIDEVFAPAFSYVHRRLSIPPSAFVGLQAVSVLPATSSFLAESITNYRKDREDDTRLDTIFHNFDTSVCASFFGNRPLSSYQRIYQALDGRKVPFNGQHPFGDTSQALATSSSSAFFRDRVHFSNCLTLTSTLSRSVSQPTPTPSNSILYIPPTRTESSTLVSHTVSNTPYEMPPPPFVLPGEGESRAVLAAAAAGSLVAISVNPSAAAAVARMTSVIDVVNGIAQNDCTGSDDDSSPDLVSAPFQMNFGPQGGGFLLGTVVGNILLNFLMFALTAGGYWSFLKFYRKERRLPSPFAMNSGGRARFLRDSLSFTGLVVGVEILLYSTLSAGFIVSVRNNPLTNFGARAAAIVLTLFIVVACARWCWSLLFSRDRYEKFRRSAGNHQLFGNNNNNSNSSRRRSQNHHNDDDTLQREDDDDQHQPGFCSVVWAKVKHVLAIITGEEGQWIFPSSLIGTRPSAPQQQSFSFFNYDTNNKNKNNKSKTFKSNRVITSEDKYLWFYAEPLVEGFTDRLPRFMCVEFGVQALLALSIVVGELAGSGRTGCLVQGCLVILIFMLYFIATLVWRPYNDLLSRITTPATTLIEVITIVIALAEVEIAALSGLVVALSSMQLIVAVVSLLQWVIAVGWPAFRAVVLRGRHRKGRSSKNSANSRFLERDDHHSSNNLMNMQMMSPAMSPRNGNGSRGESRSRQRNGDSRRKDRGNNSEDNELSTDLLHPQAMLLPSRKSREKVAATSRSGRTSRGDPPPRSSSQDHRNQHRTTSSQSSPLQSHSRRSNAIVKDHSRVFSSSSHRHHRSEVRPQPTPDRRVDDDDDDQHRRHQERSNRHAGKHNRALHQRVPSSSRSRDEGHRSARQQQQQQQPLQENRHRPSSRSNNMPLRVGDREDVDRNGHRRSSSRRANSDDRRVPSREENSRPSRERRTRNEDHLQLI